MSTQDKMAMAVDTLRPEVREAVSDCDREHWARIDGKPTPWSIIRAELLRLADENAGLQAGCDQAGRLFGVQFERAERAEAELAALKARIAGSARVEVTLGCAIDGEIPPDLALCKVALVKVEK